MLNVLRSLLTTRRPAFTWTRQAFSVVAAFALLFGMGAARPFDTISTRTYISSQGRFQLQFPAAYSLHVDEVSVAGTSVFHPVQQVIELDAPGHPRPTILIEYMYNMSAETLDDFIENSSECDEITGQPGQDVFSYGMPGRVYRDINCNSKGETRLYMLNGDVGYIILLQGKPVDQAILNMLLANFSPLMNKR